MGAILDLIQEQKYTFRNCQVLRYDRSNSELFPTPYLTKLYRLMRASGRRGNWGTLPDSFCGMTDLTHDNVTAYLATRSPLLILGVWVTPIKWEPAGIAFFSMIKGEGKQKFAFGAYSFFMDWWGKPEITLLGVLGLAYFFREFGLQALVGERYHSNERTARFMRQFGFRDVGTLSHYLAKNGGLVPGVISECLPEDFERCAEKILTEAVNGERVTEQPRSGHPAGDAAE